MAIKTLRVFQEFTSAGYIPMPVAGNIDYGVTIAGTFPGTTPTTFQTDDPDIDVTLTATTDYYVWIRSHGTDWNPMYTRNVRVYPDSPLINNVVMGIIIANLSNTVPYTGATANVNLGEYGLTAGYLGLDLTPTGTPTTVGTMSWNDADGTMDLKLKGGNVTLQVGQEQVTRIVNKTGVNLLEANYQAVRISGAQGNRLKVDLAQANIDANSAETLGLVTETINNNQEGFITTSGLVRAIDTTGTLQGEVWNDGDVLYLSGSVAGQITNIKPQAPTHTVIMGYVVRAHQTQGQIYVKVDNGYELDELHNVKITSVANKNTLVYDTATLVWKNRNIFGTQGYIPYYDDTLLMKDSIIYTNGTNVGIGSTTLTEKLVVNGNILAAQFKKVGGLSTEFLKADGSSDATAYQPLSADLTAIDNLALTTGLLRKNGTDTWELDQTEYLSVPNAISTYQRIDNLQSNLTASATKYPSVNAVNSGLALKLNLTGGILTGGLTLNYSYPNIALSDVSSGTTWNITNDGGAFKLNYGATNKFYIFSNGNAEFINNLTASALIKAGGTSTQFLKADGSVDSTTYQPYDADLSAIAALALTTGLLRKNGANTWELDQTEYVALSTLIANYQTIANLSSNLTASATKYPSVNAVNTGLNLKLNLSGGTMTGDLALSYSIPTIQLSDTSSGTIWNIQNDGGGFEINSGITNKFVMLSSGNATFVNDLTANKFIKSGGTSAQFLMADGSVSSGNAGTVTSVGLSAPTGFSVSGSPVTSSGTLALSFALGYSLPTTASQGTWDTAYNRSLVSIGVSGTTTKTLTLTKQDGTTLSASWSDINTDAVTSVFGRTGIIIATSGDYTTAQVTESGNLYYLDSRARASISGGTGISYNSTTGVITNTITQYTDALARASISGGTGISYNSTSGVITNTITQYTDALARASLSFVAGSGAYNSTTGVITIPTNTSQLTNGAGYITGITSLMVTNALGYTPYNSSNPSGYISGITSGMVTTALGYTPVTNARQLTINGTTYDLSADRSWTISGTIGGLTSGYIPKATSASTLGNSLIYDNGTNIHIGGSSAPSKLTVSGDIESMYTTSAPTVNYLKLGTYGNGAWGSYIGAYSNYAGTLDTDLRFGVSVGGTATEIMRLTSDGNILVGTTIDNGAKLQLNGTLRFNYANYGYFGLGYISGADYGIFNYNYGRTDLIFTQSTGAATFINSASATSIRSSGVGTFGFNTVNNGEFQIYATAADGMVMAGRGSNTDMVITNKSGSDVFRIPTGTTIANFVGNVGINTSSPNEKLQISGGNAYISGVGNALLFDTDGSAKTITQYVTNLYEFHILNGRGNTSRFILGNGSISLGTSSSPFFYINTTSGNILINTTNDSGYKLNVNGTFNVSGSTFFNGVNSLVGSSYFKSSSTLGFVVNDSTDTYNNFISYNNGNAYVRSNLGIGTTSPGYKLEVNGSFSTVTSNIYLQYNSGILYHFGGSGDYYQYISGANYLLYNRTATGALTFGTQDTERMRITSGGNLCVGDTSDYNVRMNVVGLGATPSTGSGSSNIVMLLRDTTTGGINVGAGIGFAGNDGVNTGVTFATINGRKENSTSGNYASYLSFRTRANGDVLTEQLRISSTGAATFSSNVTVTGVVYTDVVATRSGASIDFRDQAAASIMYLDATNKRVGIGTTSPVAKFQVVGSSGAGIRVDQSNYNYYGAYNHVWMNSGFTSTFMTLDNSGNLGLGVTPSAWVDYKGFQIGNQGSIGATSTVINFSQNVYYGASGNSYIENGKAAMYQMNDGVHGWRIAGTGTAGNAISFTQAMTLTSGGNLLVGTTTDSGYKLDVNGGNLRVKGSTNEQLVLDYTTASGGFTWQSFRINGTNKYRFIGYTDNTFALYSDVLSTSVLSIASTGAATFSSSVTAGGTITQSSSSATLLLNRTGGTTYGAGVQYQTSGTNNWIVGTGQTTVGTDYQIYNYNTGSGAIAIGYNSNYVGIGVTSPANRLQIGSVGSTGYGGNDFVIGNGTNVFAIYQNDTATNIYATKPFSFQVSNVLIGTTTDAGYKLDVSGTGRFSGNVTVGLGNALESLLVINGQTYSGLRFQRAGTTKWAIFNNNAGTDFIDFYNYTTSSSAFYISATNAATFSSSVTAGGDVLVPYDSTDRFIGARYSGTYYNGLTLNGGTRSTGVVSRSGDASDYIWFGTNSATERMRITNAGNLGLGTTSPATKMEIFGTDGTGARTSPYNVLTITAESGYLPYNGFGGGIVFNNRAYTSGIVTSSRIRSVINNNSVDTSGGAIAFDVTPTVGGSLTQAMLINYNGYVGIGITPSRLLDVNGTMRIADGSAIEWGGTSTAISGTSASNALLFYTTSAERMRITSGGNVGINCTGNNARLEVVETSGEAFRVDIASGAYRIIANQSNVLLNGNVLIGTTTDSGYKLDVNGSGRFSGSLYMKAPAGVGTFIQFTNDSNTTGFDIGHLNGAGAGAYIYQRANQPLIFGTNNATVLTLAGSGAATFSSSVSANGFNFNTGARTFKSYTYGTDLTVNTTSGWAQAHRIYNEANTTQTWFFGAIETTAYIKFGNPASIDVTGYNGVGFQLTSTGAGTFASSVTATSFFESSDFKLKRLIEHNPIIKGIEKLQSKLYEKNGKVELGYFAQDAQHYLPNAVTKGSDGFLNLSYREVHTAKIASLEQRVLELETQLNLR